MTIITELSIQNAADWDRYVSQHASSSPYHFSSWIFAVEKAYGHQHLGLIALDEGNVIGVMPLVIFSIPFKGKHFCSLPFCDVGGVLANDNDTELALLDKATKLLQQNKLPDMELRTYLSEAAEEGYQGKVRMIMPLPENSETLMASFKSKLRSQIRKAEKNGLHSEIFHDQSAIDSFYDVFSRNMRDLGSPVHSKSWFQALSEHYQDKMVTFLVKKDEVVMGGAIVLLCGNKASIPWASTLAEHNRLAPNMLLYWSVLEHLSDSNIEEFDFGRSSYGEGTYKFKKQWGAQPVPLTWQTIASTGEQKEISTVSEGSGGLRSKVESIWRKLPLGLTQLVGPIVRRYISL